MNTKLVVFQDLFKSFFRNTNKNSAKDYLHLGTTSTRVPKYTIFAVAAEKKQKASCMEIAVTLCLEHPENPVAFELLQKIVAQLNAKCDGILHC